MRGYFNRKNKSIDFLLFVGYNISAKQTKYTVNGSIFFRGYLYPFLSYSIAVEFDKMQVPYSNSIVIYPFCI